MGNQNIFHIPFWIPCVCFKLKKKCTPVVSISCFTSCDTNMFICLKTPQRWWRAPAAQCSSVSCSSIGTRCSTLWKWSRDTSQTKFSKCLGASSLPSWPRPATWTPSTACTQTTSTEPSLGEARNCSLCVHEKKRLSFSRILQAPFCFSTTFMVLYFRTAEASVQIISRIILLSLVLSLWLKCWIL